ncbi:conserved hypothetical protein [Mesorhizobium delmotii]|uniref:Uncharacterized protein n=1 Tax=Mesorhizobium delmotii TaxID=1631247 RepID=A0A2P9AX33_9HYPH|nr:conserved hypothetical protein [Mesorhizobium delmotii]
MAVVVAADALEARHAGAVFLHPFRGELAGLDILQHALHLGLGVGGDDARTRDIFAPFGGVRDRVVHVGDAALIDQVDDQLDLVQALEIGHFRRIAGFHQRLETGADQFDQAAAQDNLLAEQIGFAFLAEIGLDDARTAAADAAGIGQSEIERIARSILVDRDQARHAAALLVFAAHRVARPLRRDHDDVDRCFRLDQAKVHVQAVGERDRRAIADVRRDLGFVDVGLQLVWRRHHHQVGPCGGLRHAHHLEPVGLDLLGGCRAGLEADGDILDAGVLEVERVRPALAAIADDGDLLALDQVEIGVAIVIDTHFSFLPVLNSEALRPGFCSIKSEKLLRRPDGIAADSRLSQFQPVAEQQANLHVTGDQPEKGAECRFGIRELEKPGLPAGLQHRLQAPGQREAAVLQDDGAKIVVPRASTANGDAVQRDRCVARNHLEPVRSEACEAHCQRSKDEPLAVDRRHAHLGGLPLHRCRQQPVAIAEPFVERLLGTARPPRHGGHGQLIALLDQQAKCGVEHGFLPLRQRFAGVDIDGCLQQAVFLLDNGGSQAVPYVTVRLGYDVLSDPVQALSPLFDAFQAGTTSTGRACHGGKMLVGLLAYRRFRGRRHLYQCRRAAGAASPR